MSGLLLKRPGLRTKKFVTLSSKLGKKGKSKEWDEESIKFPNDDDSSESVLSLGVTGVLLGLVYSGTCPIIS